MGGPLVLKVMRLRRPITEPPSLLPTGLASAAAPAAVAFSDAPKLLLPMVMTQSLVGEPFSGYLHLTNTSAAPVSSVAMRVDMQLDSTRVTLFDNHARPLTSLAAGEFWDFGVEHELQDAGTFVLMCAVSYSTGVGTAVKRETFKRSYRFPAPHPFVVSRRVVQLGPTLLVECGIQNATAADLYLTSVNFECAEGLEVPGRGSLLPSAKLLRARDGETISFRIAPCTPPAPGGAEIPRAIQRLREQDVIGHLALGWQTVDGPSGCVEGHQIRLSPLTNSSVDLRMADGPRRVSVEEPFSLEAEVTNWTGRPLEPCLVVEQRLLGALRLRGATRRPAGRLEPNEATRVGLDLLAMSPGLHTLRGLAIVDELTQAKFDFGPVCEIVAF